MSVGDKKLRRIFDPARSADIRAASAMRFMQPGNPVQEYSSGPQLPPTGQSAIDTPFTRIQYPPWTVKLPESKDFNVNDYAVALAAGVGNTATSANWRFQVPASQIGWLQNFALYILAPVATSSVQWTIRINDGPVSGWDNIQNPPGIALFLYLPFDELQVRLPNHCTVDVVATNRSANAETVGAVLGGWYHPSQAEERAWGSVV